MNKMNKNKKQDPREVPDTRGRPRNDEMGKLTDRIEKAYMTNKLPIVINCPCPKETVKKLRMATTFKEMQEEIGVPIRILVGDGEFTCCLRRG